MMIDERALFVFENNDGGELEKVAVQLEGIELPPSLAHTLISVRGIESTIEYQSTLSRLLDRQTNALERIAAALEQPITIKEEDDGHE